MENNIVNAKLTLDSIAFEEITYSRKNSIIVPSSEYEMNFVRKLSVNDDKEHCKVDLTANVRSKDDNVSLKITITGYFSCSIDNEELRNTLFSENAIAILFPYLRSQVSLVSTQPSMPPIVIPPVNIVEMFRNSKE